MPVRLAGKETNRRKDQSKGSAEGLGRSAFIDCWRDEGAESQDRVGRRLKDKKDASWKRETLYMSANK